MSYICDISPLRGSECVPGHYEALQMLVIGVRHTPIKLSLKKLIVFRPPFGLNNEYGGILKGGAPPPP